MTATKNGWTIEGTPAEIWGLITFDPAIDSPEIEKVTMPTDDPEPGEDRTGGVKTPERKPRKVIDWGKADALHKAGWNYKAIAEEIGATYQGVYRHFNAAEKVAEK